MNTSRGEDVARSTAGKVEQAAGTLSGTTRLKAKGEVRQASGELEAKLAERLGELREWTVQRPITALVITACIAFVRGARWASQWHRDNAS